VLYAVALRLCFWHWLCYMSVYLLRSVCWLASLFLALVVLHVCVFT